MKRRNAIIRVLAAVASAFIGKEEVRAQVQTESITGRFPPISKHQQLVLRLVDSDAADAYGMDKIILEYKGRRIELTAREIMDALEER